MLILLACISLVGLIVSRLVFLKTTETHDSNNYNENTPIVVIIFGCVLIVSVIGIFILLLELSSENAIDSKIEMYQEENANIEQEIDTLVKQYMNYEQEVFNNLKIEEDSISLVTLIPELSSDTLVQKQLEIYLDNNAKIKSLKEDKINLSTSKWLIYFGE